MKKTIGMFALACISLALAGCNQQLNSDQVQRQQQEALSAQGNAVVGMPAIINFREKKLLKMILEMRDKEIATITYTQDMNGHLHKLCDSIGYGIPYATQYTNPQRLVEGARGSATLPQADPNALFSPAAADGTWVMCANPETKGFSPLYSEPHVIVSPFALTAEK